MTPTEIKIEFLKRKIKMAAIARELKVSQPAVQRVVERESVSERIMTHIAEIICMPPDMVFPEHEFKNQPKNNSICRNLNISQHQS